MNSNAATIGIALAIAIVLSSWAISDAWRKVHQPIASDPVAQRISQLDVNDSHYSQMVSEVVQAAKKDTVVIYRDTCK